MAEIQFSQIMSEYFIEVMVISSANVQSLCVCVCVCKCDKEHRPRSVQILYGSVSLLTFVAHWNARVTVF
jgi:hypothetical protein